MLLLFENGGGGRGGFSNFDFSSHFSDIFEDFFGDFGGGGRRSRKSNFRGSDLRYDLSISLEEASSNEIDKSYLKSEPLKFDFRLLLPPPPKSPKKSSNMSEKWLEKSKLLKPPLPPPPFSNKSSI